MAVILLTVLLLLPPAVTLVLLTVAVLIGAWEWSAFIRDAGRGMRVGYVALVAALLAIAWEYCSERAALRAVLLLTALWWLVALAWITLAPQRVAPWSAALAGVFALVPAWAALAQLRQAGVDGGEWTLYALVLIVAADTGAFFAGRRFGRFKLAPRVSPAKTWEGVLGGMLLALLTGLAGAVHFGVPVLPFVAVAFAAAGFSVVGDLTESLLKRAAGVKDSGHLFPGHGGMLDRLDSIAAGAPLFVLGLLLIGAMP
jgi:phosphatidate cytidylyltransferase